MSLIYLMGRVGAILVHSQNNPFLVFGGVFLGNMFLMSWRMGSNHYQAVSDLLSWYMVINIPLFWDTLLTVKQEPPEPALSRIFTVRKA